MRTRTKLAAVWPPTAAVAREAGHTSNTLPLEAIRRKCLDCCCHQQTEVRLCEAVNCPLWPFRAGRYPVGRRNFKNPDTVRDFEQGGCLLRGIEHRAQAHQRRGRTMTARIHIADLIADHLAIAHADPRATLAAVARRAEGASTEDLCSPPSRCCATRLRASPTRKRNRPAQRREGSSGGRPGHRSEVTPSLSNDGAGADLTAES